MRDIGLVKNDEIMYKEYGLATNKTVEDGDNVHQSYRLFKLSEIRGLIFEVDI